MTRFVKICDGCFSGIRKLIVLMNPVDSPSVTAKKQAVLPAEESQGAGPAANEVKHSARMSNFTETVNEADFSAESDEKEDEAFFEEMK